MALSRDGKHLVTGSSDRTAILWQVAGGKKLQTFQGGHTREITNVALSGDGKNIVTGSLDQTVSLWQAVGSKKFQTFPGAHRFCHGGGPERRRQAHRHGILGQDSDPLGGGQRQETPDLQWAHRLCLQCGSEPWRKVLVTGSSDRTAILWEVASSKKLQTFQGHTREITSVALSGEGKLVLTGSCDNRAVLWEAISGKKLQTFQGHAREITSVALSDDGKLVVTGSEDRTAILWDAAGGKKLQIFRGHTAEIRSVALSGDSKRLWTASNDGTRASGMSPPAWNFVPCSASTLAKTGSWSCPKGSSTVPRLAVCGLSRFRDVAVDLWARHRSPWIPSRLACPTTQGEVAKVMDQRGNPVFLDWKCQPG